jgi:ABC-2 type transport system ATP-binding protein
MIEVRGLVKRHERHVVFEQLNLEWHGPGLICIRGPNGSGKTTLLTMLAGAASPDAGDIRLQGKSLVHDTQAALALVSYVPDGCPVYPFLTGREWLDLTRSLRVCDPEVEQDLLVRFKLAAVLDTRFDAMSLGTAKKFLLTAGLMCKTAIVVMDEPTNGLDKHSFAVLQEHLERRKQSGLIVLSCHDQAQQRQLGARPVELRDLDA